MSGVWRQVFTVLLWLLVATRPAMADPLSETLRVMAATPVVPGVIDLAAHEETAGHWQFANRAGDRFTVSLDKPDELPRALAMLAPERKPAGGVALHLTRDALVSVRSPIFSLVATTYRVVVGGTSYPAAPAPPSTNPRQVPTIELAPGWMLGTWDGRILDDALQSLTRPLKRSDLRVIALTPGAPRVLSATPRIDADSTSALVDPIDPSAAAEVVATARHQVLIFSGEAVDWSALRAAARQSDVTVVRVETGSAAQPGSRNFLWLPVRTPLMKAHAEQLTLLDVLRLSAGRSGGTILVVRDGERISLDVRLGAAEGPRAAVGRWLDKLSEVAGDLTGNVQARGIAVSLPSPARQAELDRRIIKSVPSWMQFGYAALILLGLAGLPTAWRWFARVWPQEIASDYANAAGFHAARAVRAALFAVVFMPLVAIVAAPAHLLSLIKRRPA